MHSLKSYNSFGVEAQAEELLTLQSTEQLQAMLPYPKPILILGEGSNVLFTKNWAGLVLLNRIKGLTIAQEDENSVLVKVGAGENWHEFTQWAVKKGYAGLENLSLIPGTVGAAPIQNIGAYGLEQEAAFVRLEAVELATGKLHIFEKNGCYFGYRESIFKRELKNQFCIVSVSYLLSKKPSQLHLQYGDIQHFIQQKNISQPTIADIAQAVIEIRQQKLPNPAELGNAGSFFKNPIVSKRQYKELLEQYPYMPSFPVNETQLKIPAAWLIQQSGWRGRREGDAGVSEKHALVLVNYGKASGMDIKNLALDILHAVKQRFNLMLTPEVNIL